MARSTSGTICTKKIIEILEAGARCGVVSLKILELGLEVSYKEAIPQTYAQQPNFTIESLPTQESSGISTEGPYDKEELERMARELKEQKLATLALEDPLEYEEILANPDRYIALFGNEG